MSAAGKRSGQAPLAGLVLAGHLLLLAALGSALRPARWMDTPAPAAPLAWLRLLADPAQLAARAGPATPPPQAMATRPAPARQRGARQPSMPTPTELPTAAPALPVLPVGPAARTPDPPVGSVSSAPPAPATSATPSALNLALPSARQRASEPPAAWVRGDERVNPAPLSRDERLARALGTDTTLSAQQLSDGTLRLRRGTGCVDVRPSRAQQLDPFNQSTHPLPRAVESCR